MFRHPGIYSDWQLFWPLAWRSERVVSRFALELGTRNIVLPHLAVLKAPHSRGDVYTFTEPVELALFIGRGADHLAFLLEELTPALAKHIDRIVCVDGVRGTWCLPQEEPAQWRSCSELSAHLNRWSDALQLEPGFFDALRVEESDEEDGEPAPASNRRDAWYTPEDVELLERHPIRLWEALFWRGHTRHIELIEGEVPHLALFPNEACATATLAQCLEDAERLIHERPIEEAHGWFRVGPFRFQRRGARLELRLRLSPADRRIIFLPQRRIEGDDAVPSLPAVISAGGDKGKMEMIDGCTWSTALCRSADEAQRLSVRLREQLSAWIGQPVRLVHYSEEKEPEERGGWKIEVDRDVLRVHVPMTHENRLPWRICDWRWYSSAWRD